MPNVTSGFTGTEIVSRVMNYIGNNSSSFQTYIEQSLPLAEFRFCKMHDWSFLYKSGLSLTVTNGTAEYDLTVGSIGYYMSASDVEQIRDESEGVILRRLDLNQIRRLDPENDDGSSTDTPVYWAPVNDNRIRIWPPTVQSGTLKIDGKITPVALQTLSNYPTIPYRYQEGFIAYVIAMALDRENDDRAPAKIQEAMALIRADIQDDMRNSSNVENPRIKDLREAENDGVGGLTIIPGFMSWDE